VDLGVGLRFWRREKSLVPTEIRNPACQFRSLFSIITKLFRLNNLLQDFISFCPVLSIGTKMYHTVKQVIPSPDRLSQWSVFSNHRHDFWSPGLASALERRRASGRLQI
jgi:hypothetical protein